MAITKDQTNKLLLSGAVAGFATPYLLKWIVMPILNMLSGIIPAVSLKLASPATIELNIRQSLTGIQAGLAGWLADALGITVPTNLVMVALMGAAGGALLFLGGAYVADWIGMLTGNARRKTAIVIFSGSILAGLILGTTSLSLGITTVNVLIAFAVNAAILAWVYTLIPLKGKFRLIPF